MSLCILTHKYTDKDIHILTQIHTHIQNKTPNSSDLPTPAYISCLYILFVVSLHIYNYDFMCKTLRDSTFRFGCFCML